MTLNIGYRCVDLHQALQPALANVPLAGDMSPPQGHAQVRHCRHTPRSFSGLGTGQTPSGFVSLDDGLYDGNDENIKHR